MAKFPKGSEEAKQHMKELRERRNKVKKDKIKEVVKDAIDKYLLEGTAKITIPDKVVKIENGHPQLIDSTTKTGNLKTINGHKVIDIKTNKVGNIMISNHGTRLNDKSRQFKFEMTDKKLKSITQNRNNLEDQLNELNEQLKKTKKRNERLEINKKIDELKSMKDEAEEQRKEPSKEWWKMTNTLNDENDKLTRINMAHKSLKNKKKRTLIIE